jgi:sulfocyanin SoxE-like protein
MAWNLNVPLLGALTAGWALGACSAPAPRPTAGAAPVRAESTTAPAPGAHSAPDTGSPAAPAHSTEAALPTAAAAGAPANGDSSYVRYDAATKTVTFRLVAGPFQFNGFGNGGGTLTVPAGSTNVWNFEQADGTPHSAEVATGTGPVPNAGGDPAIPRAYTNKVVEGLPQGATDVIKFTAPDTGSYRIICGVPGHALSGMWIWLKIDPAAKTPTFGATKQ